MSPLSPSLSPACSLLGHPSPPMPSLTPLFPKPQGLSSPGRQTGTSLCPACLGNLGCLQFPHPSKLLLPADPQRKQEWLQDTSCSKTKDMPSPGSLIMKLPTILNCSEFQLRRKPNTSLKHSLWPGLGVEIFNTADIRGGGKRAFSRLQSPPEIWQHSWNKNS